MWNRPTERKSEPSQRKPTVMRGLIGGLVVVMLLGVTLVFCFRDSTPVAEAEKATKSTSIKEVTPAQVKPQVAEEPTNNVRRTAKGTPIPDNVKKDEKGIYRYPNGQRWVDRAALKFPPPRPQPRKLFKFSSENRIAHVLKMDPSKIIPSTLGRRKPFDESFVADFKESFNDTVVIDKDDTPEEAELRKATIETKAELKARMDAGEDIAKIMNDSVKEIERLCQYQDDLKKMVRKAAADENVSEDDFKDYVDAANVMLEKQGLPKLTMPNLTGRRAMLEAMRERRLKAEREAAKQGESK